MAWGWCLKRRTFADIAWLALALIPVARSADPPDVSIRSAAWKPPAPTISAQASLVESGVTVYDARGNAIGGFKAGDFLLTDNRKPELITFFSEQRRSAGTSSSGPAQPRNVALFFDDLHLTAAGLPIYRQAAEKLITPGLPPGERMGIFTDYGTVTVDFTTDTAALLAALPQIKSHRDPGERGMTVCPTLTTYSAFIIKEGIDEGEKRRAVYELMGCDHLTWDEAVGQVMDMANNVWENSRHYATNALDVLKIVVGHLEKQEGTRVLVMISGGYPDDDRMKPQIGGILDAATRARVVIDSLAVESQMGFRQLVVTNTMTEAASSTGGRVIKNTNDLDGALSALATAPELSYLIGFQPGEPDGKYHTLKVALPNRAGLTIDARPGYFATLPAPTVQQRIDRTVLSRDVIRDVAAIVRVTPLRNTVKVTVDIDARHLRFAKQGELHLQQLTFVSAIEDAQGNFIAGKQAVMDLRVKPAKLASMQSGGLHIVESFSLPKGVYTLRQVVRELVQDRIAASNTAIELK